jgi:hypothetical protein
MHVLPSMRPSKLSRTLTWTCARRNVWQRRSMAAGDDELLNADCMSVQPLDSVELDGLLEQAYKKQHGEEGLLPGGTLSLLLFQGIDLQQDAASPGYVPVVASAPVVSTLGSRVAPGQQFDAASLLAAVTSQVG